MSDRDAKRERMLVFIQDTLIDRAQSYRQAFEQNSVSYCLGAEGEVHRKRVVAIEAAADVFIHLVAEWKKEEEGKRPDWLKVIARQAVVPFIEEFK